MSMETGLAMLIFTYGFTIAYHVMGSTKFYMIKEFDWKKALLGIYQEVGYFLFLLMLFLIPQYIDISQLGIDIDLDLMISIVLVFPLVSSLNNAYKKALQLRRIDISELNNDLAEGASIQKLEGVKRIIPMKMED